MSLLQSLTAHTISYTCMPNVCDAKEATLGATSIFTRWVLRTGYPHNVDNLLIE